MLNPRRRGAFTRLGITFAIVGMTTLLGLQYRFITSEFHAETPEEAKARRAEDKLIRNSFRTVSDGERDLVVWRAENEARIQRLLDKS